MYKGLGGWERDGVSGKGEWEAVAWVILWLGLFRMLHQETTVVSIFEISIS